MFKYRNCMNYIFIDFFPCQAKLKKKNLPPYPPLKWVGRGTANIQFFNFGLISWRFYKKSGQLIRYLVQTTMNTFIG